MTQASLKFTNRKSWLEIFKQSFCLSLLNAGLCHKPPILAQFPQKMFSLFYLNPCEYVTRVSRRGTGVELQGQTFLRQLSISTRWALRVRLGGDCCYPMGHLAGHYLFVNGTLCVCFLTVESLALADGF